MVTIPDRQPFIQTIKPLWYEGRVAELSMLRLDVIHPEISGNKWYKLKQNILYCLANNISTIITFGGAYSNHLAATAACAKYFGLTSVGIVKGKYAEHKRTHTLQQCEQHGMQLVFVSNEDYSRRNDPDWIASLSKQYKRAFIIPEGGANEQGRAGSGEITRYITDKYSHIAVSVGTGTTYTGIANLLERDKVLYGYAPMKGGEYLNEAIRGKVTNKISHHIYASDAHGGFGKWSDELVYFMNDFYLHNNIPLDIIYMAKMMYTVKQQLLQGVFPYSAKVLCIHTGGLQGNRTVANKLVY